MTGPSVHVLTVVSDRETLDLVSALLGESLRLVPFDIDADNVNTRDELLERMNLGHDESILLDWTFEGPGTPDLVREIARVNPRARVIVLLPEQMRQYRESTWEAGACGSIPKDLLDQEWMSSVLCMISRSMEREERLRLVAS